jgi:hypothetical protein
MPVEPTLLEPGGVQYVLHGASGHPALVKQRSGLLDDALPGLFSLAHGNYQISKKKDASVSFLLNPFKDGG